MSDDYLSDIEHEVYVTPKPKRVRKATLRVVRVHWKDVSSWSQSTTPEERKTPKAWEVFLGPVRVVVTRYAHSDPGAWVCRTTPRLLGEVHELKSTDIEAAKREAVELVVGWCQQVIEAAKGGEG